MALLENSEWRGKVAAAPDGVGWGVLAAGQQMITGMLLVTGAAARAYADANARQADRAASSPVDGDNAPSAPTTAESEAPSVEQPDKLGHDRPPAATRPPR